MDTHPRTRAPEEPTVRRQTRIKRRKGFPPVAQAACCFNCSASKRTPFFQTSKVMAAILRAKVRRAIGGFMPLGDASLVEILERPSCGSRSRGSYLTDIFQIMIVIFVQS